MIKVSEQEIKDFLDNEFPGQPYLIGCGYWYVQAGKCLGQNLHYEYQQIRFIYTLRDLIGEVYVIIFGLMLWIPVFRIVIGGDMVVIGRWM